MSRVRNPLVGLHEGGKIWWGQIGLEKNESQQRGEGITREPKKLEKRRDEEELRFEYQIEGRGLFSLEK